MKSFRGPCCKQRVLSVAPSIWGVTFFNKSQALWFPLSLFPLDHPLELGQELLLLLPGSPGGVRPIADFPHKSWPIGVRLEVFKPDTDPPVGADVIGPFPQVPPDMASDLAVFEELLVEIVSGSFLLFPKLQVELIPNVSIAAELDAADVVVDAAAKLLEELVFDKALLSIVGMTDPGVKLGSSVGSCIPLHGLPG